MSLEIPSLTENEVRVANAAARVANDVAINLCDESRLLRFPAEASEWSQAAASLHLEIDGQPLRVDVSQLPVTEEKLAELGVVSFPELPPKLQQILVERAVDEDLDRFESWAGVSIELGSEKPQTEFSIAIPFSLNNEIQGNILTTDQAAPLISQLISRLPQRELDLSDQMIALGIEAGRTTLSSGEFDELESGDVVLIDSGPDLRKGHIEMRPAPSVLIRASISETTLTIEERMSINPDDEESANETEAEPAAATGDIPVELVFELGRQQVTLADLNDLQPGSTIELESGIDESTISIRANGKKIGNGQLVQVGGKIGIRLS